MNQAETEALSKIVAKAIAQVGIAIGVIVDALKEQPGFDSEAFNKYISARIASADPSEKDGIAASILAASAKIDL
ncbi:hypothetical protein [Pseudomonas lactis]|uniref:hypothetical protein n=1 Tax=Pseudomonas lactis TaxID=1615674 RepID=UPI001472CB22|nr:hypothetical protein [Pseudomonas lactis]NNA50199.1 hypothetical protein [Pseudomonas lactis]